MFFVVSQFSIRHWKFRHKYCLRIRYSFILGGAKVLFFWLPGQKQQSSPKSKQIFPQRRLYVPQVSINCLACPKGVEYALISDAQIYLSLHKNYNLNFLLTFFKASVKARMESAATGDSQDNSRYDSIVFTNSITLIWQQLTTTTTTTAFCIRWFGWRKLHPKFVWLNFYFVILRFENIQFTISKKET